MNSDVCDGTSFADVAVRLQDLMLGNQPVPQMLDDLAGYTAQRLGGPGRELACNITLARPKKPVARAASSSVARLMNQLEGAYADSPGATVPGCSVTQIASGRIRRSSIAAVCMSWLSAALAAR